MKRNSIIFDSKFAGLRKDKDARTVAKEHANESSGYFVGNPVCISYRWVAP